MTPSPQPPAVSVTVPVYNTSRHLRRCLDSLAAQTLAEIEFVVVDDGSTDDSGVICDEYAARDARFRVIHKANGGLASARQAGLEAARGEYVIPCDSDDWVEPEMYATLHAAAKTHDADIAACAYIAEYPGGKSAAVLLPPADEGIMPVSRFLRAIAGRTWTKLVRRSLYARGAVAYDPAVSMSEDIMMSLKLARTCPRIVYINAPLYHYRRERGGASYTNRLSMKHVRQMELTYRYLCDNFTGDADEDLRYRSAVNLAFAAIRANDSDPRWLADFLDRELPQARINANAKTVKSRFVALSRHLPHPLTRAALRLLYPIVYR